MMTVVTFGTNGVAVRSMIDTVEGVGYLDVLDLSQFTEKDKIVLGKNLNDILTEEYINNADHFIFEFLKIESIDTVINTLQEIKSEMINMKIKEDDKQG